MFREKRMDAAFRQRMRRHLYYGDMADLDKPSLPLTELAVEYFRDCVPDKLGHIDLYDASNLIKRNCVSPCSMVLSMLYAKRLQQRNKAYLQTMSSSDVFFISMMMASKYLYDEGVDEEVFNDEWADKSDQDVDDVNQMEMDFLEAMDWGLFTRPEEFEKALYAIERRLAWQEGLKRGWFTYSEFDVLLDADLIGVLWTQVGVECSKLMTALSAVYVTSLLSMLGSTALAVQLSGPLSSATMAFLTMQLSPLSAVSSGFSLLDPAGPSLTPYGGSIKISRALMVNGTSTDDPGESSGDKPQGSWKMDDHNTSDMMSEDADEPVSGGTEHGHHSIRPEDIDATAAADVGLPSREDPGDRGPENPPGRPSTSLWSLWFLDSLLSQLWAASSVKSKVAQAVGGSVNSVGGSFSAIRELLSTIFTSRPASKHCKSHDLNQEPEDNSHNPSDSQFRSRQRVCNRCKQQHCSDLGSHKKSVSSKGIRRSKVIASGTAADEPPSIHHDCSACSCLSGTFESCVWDRRWPRVNFGDQEWSSVGQPLSQDQHQTTRSSAASVDPISPSSLTNHDKGSPCQHCCQQPSTNSDHYHHRTVKNKHLHTSHHLHPPKDDPRNPPGLPIVHTKSDLLNVPVGFFTGMVKALQVA